jgi:fatty acid desaturase
MSALLQEPPVQKIPNYRNTVKKQIPDRWLKPDYFNLLWFLPHVALIGVSFWLLTAHFSYWTAPLLSLVIGHSMGCLGFLGHDITHGGTIRNGFIRDLLGGIAFSAFGIGPHLWRKWHNADHHGNTQIEGVDPDHLFTVEHYKHNPILKWLYKLSPLARNAVIFGSFSFRMCQHNFILLGKYVKSPKSSKRDRVVMIIQPIIQMGAWVTLTYLVGGFTLVLWGYLLPLAVANAIAICYIATNHFLNPLADERDVLASSLSVTLPRWLSWLDAWHQSFGAHVAHHLFPQAPARYVRKIEEKVAQEYPDRYHCMPLFTALKMLWKTPWVYDEEGTNLVNPRTREASPTLGHGMDPR